jgi:hypothetical protein
MFLTKPGVSISCLIILLAYISISLKGGTLSPEGNALRPDSGKYTSLDVDHHRIKVIYKFYI